MIAMIGYLVFSLINIGLMIFNVPIGRRRVRRAEPVRSSAASRSA